MRVRTNGIELEYDTFGDRGAPPMLLIMGLAMQMTAWDERFCEDLAARGFHVIRFDNRDVGLSSRIHGALPNLPAIFMGDASSAPYSLDDMANDAAGLLDALELPSAHVVGLSMGGMIAQCLALRHAARVRSLASIMSTTGNRSVGQPDPAVLGALMAPSPPDRAANIEYGVGVWRLLAGPAFPPDEVRLRERMGRAFDRAYYPEGVARQIAAIVSARDRTPALAEVRAPTVVIHGAADTLIHVSGGEATARAISGAKLVVIEGMGHDLHPELFPRVTDELTANASRA